MKNLTVPEKLLSSQEKKAILAFLNTFQRDKEPLERLVLFGSKARGDSRQDSDVDLLAIIKKGTEERIYEEVARILSLFGVYLSVKTFPRSEFKRLIGLKTPFMENVRQEGIVLWPKQ